MTEKGYPAQGLFQVYMPYGDFLLTKSGSLVGALEVSGIDPDGLLDDERAALSLLAQSLLLRLPPTAIVTQYFNHFKGVRVHLKAREHPISSHLSRRREEYLNRTDLSGSRLLYYLEIPADENLNNPGFFSFFKHLFQMVSNRNSREFLKNCLSFDRSLLVVRESLEQQYAVLQDALSLMQKKLSGIMQARPLSVPEMWAHSRFLASAMQHRLRVDGFNNMPARHWDYHLAGAGDIQPVRIGSFDALRIADVDMRYVRIAAIKSFGSPIHYGLWGAGELAPVKQQGNFVIMTRWMPMGEFERSKFFYSKEMALERQQFSLMDVVKGNDDKSAMEKQATMREAIKEKVKELQDAEALNERWGMAQSFIMAFDSDTVALRETCLNLDSSASAVRISLVWERPGLQTAFQNFQVGGHGGSIRSIPLNSTQMGCASLLYQSSRGQPKVKDLGDEEAQYVLRSVDGRPFYYSPFVNGRAFVIGVGPTRSGKTFLKSTLATHFLKYGGLYRAVDIDPGSEVVAKGFREDGAIFRVTNDMQTGFNSFAAYNPAFRTQFVAHLAGMCRLFMLANDDPNLRQLEPGDQDELDNAIRKVLSNDFEAELRSLSALVGHMDARLARKFTRWVFDLRGGQSNGIYAPLFGGQKDSIGNLDKRVAVFNLQALRDDERALQPVLQELTYRITSAFEDPKLRHVPKCFDADEAHHLLKIPFMREYLMRKVRTWGKFFASVQFWTQSPSELVALGDDWEAIRSAASTFWFFADPGMDEALYQRAFHLTNGECEAIRNLVSQREAYVIQRDIGVSKRIIIDTEPEQYVVNTSHPREAAVRDALIEQYGFAEGMRLAVEKIQEMRKVVVLEDDYESIGVE